MNQRAWLLAAVAAAVFSMATPAALAQDAGETRGRRPVPVEDVPVLSSPDQEPQALSADREGLGDLSTPPGMPELWGERPVPDFADELVRERTATSQVFENSDGTHTIRLFDEPRFFESGDGWAEIDNTVVPDASRLGVLTNAANSWSVEFAPLDEGGVRITSEAGSVSFAPVGGAAVVPVAGAGEDADTVTYREVWPGVDLVYTVAGDRVKEDIILRDPAGARSAYEFAVAGVDVASTPTESGALAMDTATGDRLWLAPPMVTGGDGRPLLDAGPTLSSRPRELAGDQGVSALPGRPGDGVLGELNGERVTDVLSVGVDPTWLEAQPASAYPIRLDPTVVLFTGSDAWRSYASNGYSCGSAEGCHARAGNSRPSNTDLYWRSVVHFPYESYLNLGARVASAQLSLSRNAGTANGTPVAVEWANVWGYNQSPICVPAFCGVEAVVNDTVQFNVTGLYDYWFTANAGGGSLALFGDEWPGAYTYKSFSAALDITIDRWAPAPTPNQPADAAVISTLTPSLSTNPVTDPDGDPVQYHFRVATGSDGQSGQVFNSGWLPGTAITVPEGILEDGRTYYWQVHSYDGIGWMCCNGSPVRSFRVDRRLGADGTQPFDTMGPLSVNLANGNLVVAAAGPQLAAVGGTAGVGLTYNSEARNPSGLLGTYTQDFAGNGFHDDPVTLQRVDPALAFNWGTASLVPPTAADRWFVRWTGFITPPVSGTYEFGAWADDGFRVWIGSTQVTNQWSCVGTCWGTGMALTAGQSYPITVEYQEVSYTAYFSLLTRGPMAAMGVPSSWLSTTAATLPPGWALSTPGAGGWQWALRAGANSSVVLVDPTGVTAEYRWTGSGYTPPPDGGGVLSANPDGTLTLQDGDGMEYLFNADGSLKRVTSALDDRNPAALQYDWSGTPARLTTITDPVDPTNRKVTLSYGGDAACPTSPPDGASVAPAGMLCQVAYWDGTTSRYWYDLSGRLVRIVDPGDATTDFGYNASGRLISVRDALANDAVAAGVITDSTDALWRLDYDTAGRVAWVESPLPAVGVARPKHTIAYGTGTTTVSSPHQSGAGVLRTVTFDTTGRQLTDTDATGIATSQVWDNPDRVLTATDAAGLVTHSHYNSDGRTTAVHGPAAGSCYTNRAPNGTCTTPAVPTTTAAYDEGLYGLAATWWGNATHTGVAKTHLTNLAERSDGVLWADFGAGVPAQSYLTDVDAQSGRFTGRIDIPTAAGGYRLGIDNRDAAVRMWVDDVLVLDAWADTTATVESSVVSSGSHRVRIDVADTTGPFRFRLVWRDNATPTWTVVPGDKLTASYGLATTVLAPGGDTTRTAYAQPHLGLVTSTSLDPERTSANQADDLVTQLGYEPQGPGGFLRRTSRTLPAGTTYTYAYYGTGGLAATQDDPCTPGTVEAIHQGGALATATSPAPANGPAIVETTRYDLAGRPRASWIGTEDPTCTTYDARGRVVQVTYPEPGATPDRVVTTDYDGDTTPNQWADTSGVDDGGNPLITTLHDPAGTIATTVDLLGRVVSYQEVSGQTTTYTYDGLGRTATSVGPGGSLAWTYDPAGRIDTVSLVATTLFDATYDTAGRLDAALYGSGATTDLHYDGLGRQDTQAAYEPGGTLIHRDIVTRNSAGQVIDQLVDTHPDANPASDNYLYDGAGRLIRAWIPVAGGTPSRDITYGFAATGGCGASDDAGLNTNRTSETVAGGPATTYCYDNADRITATTAPGIGTISYDNHGNTITIAGETHRYDHADRHLETTAGATTVSYQRDALDRIIARSVNGVVVARYGHSLAGDTPDYTLDSNGNVLERTLGLPGGVMLTTRTNGYVWSYANLHGDIVATTNAAGIKQGATTIYDPYGNPVTGTIPDNSEGDLDYGWLGQHQRPLEHQATLLPVIEMGARQYSPLLGRFLEVDPIEGGLDTNDYAYVRDPVNRTDLDGRGGPCARSATQVTYMRCRAFRASANPRDTSVAGWRSAPIYVTSPNALRLGAGVGCRVSSVFSILSLPGAIGAAVQGAGTFWLKRAGIGAIRVLFEATKRNLSYLSYGSTAIDAVCRITGANRW